MIWNISEVPIFKIILEQLNKLVNMNKGKQIDKDKTSTSQEKIIENINKIVQPEIVPIDAWRRSKKPIMIYISKIKPKITDSVEKTLDNLLVLHKKDNSNGKTRT